MTAAHTPTEDEIVAAASLWRAARREVVTSFQGTSMLPTIAPGGNVILDCGAQWQVGDIIAFVDSGHLGVHRIVASSPDRGVLLTRGDSRTLPDDPFEASDAVIGVITRVQIGDEWVAPRPAPQSWLRTRVLRFVLAAFHRGVDRCERRLRRLQKAALVFGFGVRVVRALPRWFRLRQS